MPSPKARNREAAAPANGAAVQMQQLVRTIIAVTAANEQVALMNGVQPSAENVLVDTEIDGMRYLLVRMPGADHNRASLSPREMEIVRMVAQGHQNKIIADILNISTWTVCAHVRRIFAKLGVSSRAAMVARLLEGNGLLKSPAARIGSGGLRAHPNHDLIEKLSNLNDQRRQTPERKPNGVPATRPRAVEIDGIERRAASRGNAASLPDKRPVAV